MSATLRVHRGPASSERELVMGSEHLGRLSDEVTEFTVPAGRHLFSIWMGFMHSVASWVTLREGEVVDVHVEDTADELTDIFSGGHLRLRHHGH